MSESRYTSKDCCTNCFYDSCESCRGHGCACQKYNHPGIELHANDWFNIRGRGQIASVNLREIDGCPERIRDESEIPICVGQVVGIDGAEYEVRGVEYTRVLISPPFIKPDVGLVVRPVTDES